MRPGLAAGLAAAVLLLDLVVPLPPAPRWGAALTCAGMALVDLLAARARARSVQALTRRVEALASDSTEAPSPAETGSPDVAFLARAVRTYVQAQRTQRSAEAGERDLDRAMIREVPNGLVVVGADGRVRRTNPALATLVPVRGDPLGRIPIESIAVPELQDALDEAARTRALVQKPVTVGERDLLIRAFPLAGGCMSQVLDITQVRRAERARREFVANVSHELRTPVTALLGYAEALQDDRDTLPPDALPLIEAMERNARRLGALIEDVLRLSKIEAREADLRLEPEVVQPLVREVAERFSLPARQRRVTLDLDLPDEPVEALLNVEAFEHALGNLVDNALKYAGDGGCVRVRVAAAEGGGAEVGVEDDGVGIDPIHHDRIFERFYRVDQDRGRDVGGTGLGLALVKHLCLATRSEVRVDSAPGRGSRFTIRLPGPYDVPPASRAPIDAP